MTGWKEGPDGGGFLNPSERPRARTRVGTDPEREEAGSAFRLHGYDRGCPKVLRDVQPEEPLRCSGTDRNGHVEPARAVEPAAGSDRPRGHRRHGSEAADQNDGATLDAKRVVRRQSGRDPVEAGNGKGRVARGQAFRAATGIGSDTNPEQAAHFFDGFSWRWVGVEHRENVHPGHPKSGPAYNRALSIRRVSPKNTASAICIPGRTRVPRWNVSGSKNST